MKTSQAQRRCFTQATRGIPAMPASRAKFQVRLLYHSLGYVLHKFYTVYLKRLMTQLNALIENTKSNVVRSVLLAGYSTEHSGSSSLTDLSQHRRNTSTSSSNASAGTTTATEGPAEQDKETAKPEKPPRPPRPSILPNRPSRYGKPVISRSPSY